MAKKVSPIVIPAVIDTSGVDRGVASINSKLKGVSGTGGGTGGGGGNGGGNFGSGGSNAAAVAAGAALSVGFNNAANTVQRVKVANPVTAGFSTYASIINAPDRLTKLQRTVQALKIADNNFISKKLANMAGTVGVAALGNKDPLMKQYGIGQANMLAGASFFAGSLGRKMGYGRGGIRGMLGIGARNFPAFRAAFNASPLARFASVGGLAAVGSYERLMGSQFSDFNAFQGYGQGVSRNISNQFYRSQKTTPNLFQSFMLGAYRKGGEGGLLTGENGLLTAGARGLRAGSYFLGSLLNNPGDTLLNAFNMNSSLWLNAQGINDPYGGARDNKGIGDMLSGIMGNLDWTSQMNTTNFNNAYQQVQQSIQASKRGNN